MRLSPEEIKPLHHALVDALGPPDLDVVAAMLGTSRAEIVPPNAVHQVAVLSLIQWAQNRDVVSELIVEAREINPRNAALRGLAAVTEVAVDAPPSLQRVVGMPASVALLSWEEGLGALEAQICCIEGIPGGGGTGFLIGPDLVMTNEHVVRPISAGNVAPDQAKLRFDYKKDRDGSIVRPGTVVCLDPGNWLLDSSPHSPLDVQPGAVGLPDLEHLDYAVLKLKERIGDEPIGEAATGAKRGWVAFPAVPPQFDAGTLAVILQHPQGKPITIAFDTMIGVDDPTARTRVRYRVDTDNGSSGSPVFDIHWNLVALHHSGDPDFSRDAKYNEGIPIDTIAALLRKRGYGGWLS
jgi:hypothetical protein